MPTEKELLALCLKWIEHPQGDAFDKAMLIEAVQAKLQPRPWVPLTEDEIKAAYGQDLNYKDGDYVRYARAIEAKLKEKNT